MNPRLDTLVTALYVRIDDLLAENPQWAPERSAVGFKPRLSDAGLVALAMVSARLGFDSESRFVRYAKAHLRPWFPCLPNRDGCNKRLRRVGHVIACVVSSLARECPDWGYWATKAQARQEISLWVHGWYNQRRLHSAIGMVPPVEYEHTHTPNPHNQPLHD